MPFISICKILAILLCSGFRFCIISSPIEPPFFVVVFNRVIDNQSRYIGELFPLIKSYSRAISAQKKKCLNRSTGEKNEVFKKI